MATGEKITLSNGTLHVPNNPILPFINIGPKTSNDQKSHLH